MSNDEAILATTKSFRTLADGGVSITFDIDPKDAANAFRLFGITGSKVGIAPITAEAARKSVQKSAAEERLTDERKSFTELRLSAQAALRCKEIMFHEFLRVTYPETWKENNIGLRSDGEVSAEAVRSLCTVSSRSEFDTDARAGLRWRNLEAEYYAWQHGRRE